MTTRGNDINIFYTTHATLHMNFCLRYNNLEQTEVYNKCAGNVSKSRKKPAEAEVKRLKPAGKENYDNTGNKEI